VAQLLKEPVGSTRTYPIDGPFSNDIGIAELLPQSQLFMMRTDKGIFVDARVSACLRVTCSRCLKRTTYPVDMSIEEEYLPTLDITTGQSLRVPANSEGTFTIDRQHGLDLQEALRQASITSQPMKPLCGDDCRGICPDCGSDNNQNPCSCSEGAVDPKWLPLTRLLEANRN